MPDSKNYPVMARLKMDKIDSQLLVRLLKVLVEEELDSLI